MRDACGRLIYGKSMSPAGLHLATSSLLRCESTGRAGFHWGPIWIPALLCATEHPYVLHLLTPLFSGPERQASHNCRYMQVQKNANISRCTQFCQPSKRRSFRVVIFPAPLLLYKKKDKIGYPMIYLASR